MAPDHDLFQTPPLTSLSVYFCSNLPGTLSMAVKKKTARRRSPGRLIGYARVSTSDQYLTLQINALKKHGLRYLERGCGVG